MAKSSYIIKEKDLLRYVDCVNMLVANVTLDIKKPSQKISTDTVVACSRLVAAAERLKAMTDALEANRSYEN